MLKCSRCRHIFPWAATQRRTERRRAEKPPREGDLSLSFDDADWLDLGTKPAAGRGEPDEKYVLGVDSEPGASPPGAAAGARSESVPTQPPAQAAASRHAEEPETPSEFEEEPAPRAGAAADRGWEERAHEGEESDEEPDEHAPARLPEEDASLPLDLDFKETHGADLDARAGEVGPREEAPMKSARWSLGPMYFFLAAVVSAYFALYRSLLAQPESADRLAARLPVVGSSLAADRLLARKVALVDVAGSFHRTRDGKEVFLVTGSALNTASRPLRSVEVEAILMDSEGQELLRESARAQSLLSRRLVPDLTLREVEILRRVEPSPPRPLGPGESAPFAIVFAQPPERAAAYECRVLAVQGAG